MTNGGDVGCLIGMCVEHDVDRRVMKRFLKDLVRRFGMDECKSFSTPMEVRLKLEKDTEEKRTKHSYRELVSCLTYVSLTTRPDGDQL